jgi:long-chain acyl-CoA synthetase
MDKYDFDVIKEPDFRTGPLFSLLEDAATRYPSRTALHFKNKVLSYAELNALSCTIAFNLHELGIGKGDKVAVMLPNLPQTVLIYWAILRTGATLVMTNPLYMESELTHLFNDSEAKLLITLDALWPKVKEVYPKTPVKRCIVTTVSEGLAFPLGLLFNLKNRKKKVTIPYDGEHILPWKRLLAGKQTYTCDVIDPEHDLAVLQYTGGTTGTAKACMLTHRNLIINAQQCSHMLCELGRDPNQQECFLGVMPFFHIYGLTVCLNFNTLIAAKMIPFVRYAPQDVLKAIDQHRPTVFPGAPSVYISLLQQKNVADFDLKSIKFCISGSAPMPVEYIEKFQQVTGAVICEGYGLSEASPVTHINPARRTRKNGSIGIPLPGTEAKVVDSDLGGEQLPHGKVGELCVRGPQVMTGYYQREDETADVLRHDWLYTGDIATMDEDGYFYIVDRKKDMIINAGFNIYPREIDEVLYAHPKIAEAVAIGIPHKNRGEMIKVFVVLKQGESMDRAEVIAYCREKLAAYKVPRLVEFRDSLPKTMVGKVLRRALREEELEKKKQKHRKDPKAAPP